MHWLGLEGMPRRYASYEYFAKAFPDAVFWNRFETVSSFLMVAAVLLFAVNIVRSLRSGRRAGNNPWGARTLEWMIASPAPYYNFQEDPDRARPAVRFHRAAAVPKSRSRRPIRIRCRASRAAGARASR